MGKIILFIFITSLLKNNLAAQYWSALGSGIGPNSFNGVYSLATYNGELYAAGDFTTAGGVSANHIAKWNGANWSALSSGFNSAAYSLGVYNGELYAGGSFTIAGGSAANRIAKWNGTNWSAVGSVTGGFQSLAVYNGELYAAGYFPNLGGPDGTSIAKWNGMNWAAVGGGVEPVINTGQCLANYNGELYAAGADIGGGGVANSYSILKWNGLSWNTLITLPASYTFDGALGDFLSMTVFNGELYVAGTFSMMIDTTNAIIAYQIAKWNGTNWSAVGTGINPASYPFGGDSDGAAYSFVGSLAVYDGALYAGGRFDSCGLIATRNIAKWNGTSWSALGQGVNGYVYDLVASDTSLYVGGLFTSVNGNNIPANKVARWGAPCASSLPQPGVITGNDTICASSPQTYSIDTVAGATSYTWTFPPGWIGNSITNTISVIAGANSGIIYAFANNSCGSSVAQILPVTANTIPQIPATIIGNDTVCEGSSQTYSITPVTGATGYAWDLSFGWAGGMHDTSIIINVVQSSHMDHIISVSSYNNCGNSDIQILPVTLIPIPVPDEINGNTKVCRGSIQNFSTQAFGANSFTWIIPPGWTGNSTSNSIVITVGDTNGTISVRANNDCRSSGFKTLLVSVDTVLPKPQEISGNIYTTTGQSENYSINTISGINNYTWSLSGGGTIATGQNNTDITVKWQSAGIYTLSVKANNSCGGGTIQSKTIMVADPNDKNPFDLKLFPNPSSGEFYLTAKRIQDKLINVEVLNMSGQVINRTSKSQGSNNYSQLIDIKKFSQGVYVVKIIIDNTVYIRRIVFVE